MKVELNQVDVAALETELSRMEAVRLDAIRKKNLTQMFNRAKHGGTPEDTRELVKGASVRDDEMGYVAEHGPHVEYGHRVVLGGRTIGYVTGQRYLEHNVDEQRDIYIQDLQNAVRGKE